MESTNQSMQIKFDGQGHQIDANTLINVLVHYNTIITEANRVVGGGDKKVSVKINAIEKGSFVIDITLVESIIKTMFSTEGICYLSGLVGIVGGVFEVYKSFKGSPIQNETKITINGDVTIDESIKVIYNQPIVREAISKSIETANEDLNVESISIYGDSMKPVQFDKADFRDLIYTNFSGEAATPLEHKSVVDAILVITKLSFEPGQKWNFLYEGFNISMMVKDGALMEHIDNGAKFGKGDAVRVRMEITKRYNEVYKAYENKSYRIIDFLEHIEQPTQTKIKF